MRRTAREQRGSQAAALSDRIDRVISAITLAGGWTVIPALIVLMLFHVLGRQVRDVASEALAELAADLFFVLAMLSFGYTYLCDGHVRVDVLRHRLGATRAAWIELGGCVLVLLPLSAILTWQGVTQTALSFQQGERTGILDFPYEWIVKSAVPLGGVLLLLSGVAVIIRRVLFLRYGDHVAGVGGGANAI